MVRRTAGLASVVRPHTIAVVAAVGHMSEAAATLVPEISCKAEAMKRSERPAVNPHPIVDPHHPNTSLDGLRLVTNPDGPPVAGTSLGGRLPDTNPGRRLVMNPGGHRLVTIPEGR